VGNKEFGMRYVTYTHMYDGDKIEILDLDTEGLNYDEFEWPYNTQTAVFIEHNNLACDIAERLDDGSIYANPNYYDEYSKKDYYLWVFENVSFLHDFIDNLNSYTADNEESDDWRLI